MGGAESGGGELTVIRAKTRADRNERAEGVPFGGAPQKRRARVVEQVETGKAKALQLIEDAGGVYPGNGGRLSQAEVCRLGGVDPTVLGGAAHRDSTRPELNAWIAGIQKSLSVGKRRVRANVAASVLVWKAMYEEVLDKFSVVELELHETKLKLKDAEERLRAKDN